MKKNIISAIAAISMMAVSALSIMTINASAEDFVGYKLVYDAENSTSTEKHIDVYISEMPNVSGGALNISFPENTVTAVTYTSTAFPEAVVGTDKLALGTAGISYSKVSGEKISNNYLGELVLTVAESTPEFTVSTVLDGKYELTDEDGEYAIYNDTATVSSVTIPGATVEEPKTPYVPTNLTAQRFDKYENDVPVDAWSTTIDYSTTEVKGALKWAISNGTGTAKVDATVVTTEGSVVYGLFIAGQAAELDTIESVKLIAETVVE